MTNDELDRALEALRSIEPPPPRVDLTARIQEAYIASRDTAARRIAPWRFVAAAAVLAVSVAGAVFLTREGGLLTRDRGVSETAPSETRNLTASVAPNGVEERFARALTAARIQSLRSVLTTAPAGKRAVVTLPQPVKLPDPAGDAAPAGLGRGELVRLAAARQWESLDPAAAAERYRGIAREDPSGPAGLVAASRLDVLAIHLKRPRDKHD